jgi:acid-sensing ion channel, other
VKQSVFFYFSMTHFDIYFAMDEFVATKRSERYSWTDFLSNCGGFLGLLMGGSLLSLVEIFYHIFMKKYAEGKRRRKNKRNNVKF